MHWSQWHAESFECPITVDRHRYKPLSLWVWIQNKWTYSRTRTERRGSRIPIHFSLHKCSSWALRPSDPAWRRLLYILVEWLAWSRSHLTTLGGRVVLQRRADRQNASRQSPLSRDTRSYISRILSWPPHWFPLATQRILFPLKWGFRLTL